MRALAVPALLALTTLAFVPSASAEVALPAAPDLPVGVRVYDDNGYLAVGAGFTGCCDLPWFAAGLRVTDDGSSTDVRVFACYTAFVGVCFVDQTVTLPVAA